MVSVVIAGVARLIVLLRSMPQWVPGASSLNTWPVNPVLACGVFFVFPFSIETVGTGSSLSPRARRTTPTTV